VRDVAVGSQHAELVDELRRTRAEARFAELLKAREPGRVPGLRMLVRELALEGGLAEVNVDPPAAFADDVGDLQ